MFGEADFVNRFLCEIDLISSRQLHKYEFQLDRYHDALIGKCRELSKNLFLSDLTPFRY
jgi:hypothetical protein